MRLSLLLFDVTCLREEWLLDGHICLSAISCENCVILSERTDDICLSRHFGASSVKGGISHVDD